MGESKLPIEEKIDFDGGSCTPGVEMLCSRGDYRSLFRFSANEERAAV